MNPKHMMAENMEQLSPMRGSKYVQCDVGFTYRRTKELLKSGRMVLYSGTPCQIAGLYSFLDGFDTDKLLTLEVVCHGVPSNRIFHNYISYIEKKIGVDISEYRFRSKKRGWGIREYMFDQEYVDKMGKKKIIPSYASAYMFHYRKNNLHRSSCFKCVYAQPNRVSDFTTGDFWDYNNVGVKNNYYNGISIFLMNTGKAVSYYTLLAQKLNLEKIEDIGAAIHTNGNLYRPSPKGKQWDSIMKSYSEGSFDNVLADFYAEHRYEIQEDRLKRLIPTQVYLLLKKIKYSLKS